MESASQKRAQSLSKINGNMLISPKCKIIFSYHALCITNIATIAHGKHSHFKANLTPVVLKVIPKVPKGKIIRFQEHFMKIS